jgi:hypothetical protein
MDWALYVSDRYGYQRCHDNEHLLILHFRKLAHFVFVTSYSFVHLDLDTRKYSLHINHSMHLN